MSVSEKFKVIIGLEIHAELKTRSKMFCGCKNAPFESKPNANICPVCTGQPGALPVPNKQAIMWAYLVGKALQADLNNAKFDRKHYYYPDLPKGYQISQYDLPFTQNGKLKVGDREIGIIRVHLEEDTGKLIHPIEANYSLLDLNRAGVPLLELVTYPEIASAVEARRFCENYQKLLRDLDIASADMEKGEMRCEANISVQEKGSFKREGCEIKAINRTKLNPKIEVKNLNSFKAVERAIDYEIERQVQAIEDGEELYQETRGWNERIGVTLRQREKESAHDYRYFPEPDIPPVIDIDLSVLEIPALSADVLPELIHLGVSEQAAKVLVDDKKLLADFQAAASFGSPKTVANLYVNKIRNKNQDFKPAEIGRLATLLDKGMVPASAVNEILMQLKEGKKITQIEAEFSNGNADIDKWIKEAIAQNPDVVASYNKGKVEALGVIVGAVMRASHGKVDAKKIRELIQNELSRSNN